MRIMGLFSLIGLLVMTGLVWAEGERLQAENFAWGLELQPLESKALYRLPVPRVVYQGVARTDLGDLAVFNAQGHQVPHDLSLPSGHEMAKVEQRVVSLFPLYGPQDANLQTLSAQLTQTLVEGQLIIRSQGTYRGQHQVLRGHVLTLRGADEKQMVTALQLMWQTSDKGFVQHLRIEQSNDLARWRLVKADAVIADLHHAGEQLRQDRLTLPAVTSRYLRLTPISKDPAVILTRAQVELKAAKQPRQAQHMRLEQVVAGEQAGEYLFQMPPALPVNRINIIPSETNSFVRVRLYSKLRPEDKWTQRASGLIYNLVADGTVVQQTALTSGVAKARYWRLLVDMSGGGFGARAPQITASWIPHDLFFSARGQGPFVLAYGSARVKPVQGQSRIMLDVKRSEALIGKQVKLGKPYVLGGQDLLKPKTEVEWKQWLLWIVLVLASLLLVGMAWSTFRQMSK